MDLDLSEEQALLKETTDRFIREQGPLSLVREWADGKPVPEDYYRRAASLGWYAPLTATFVEPGDPRIGLREAALIAEQRGRGLQPGPFVSTSVVVAALSRARLPEEATSLLDGIVARDLSATWVADWGTPSGHAGSGPQIDVSAEGVRIGGEAHTVDYGSEAEWILVSGSDRAGGITQALVSAEEPGVDIEHRQNLDVTRSVANLRFDGSVFRSAVVVGEPGRSIDDLEAQRDIAACLIAAEMVGAMDALFEQTRRYALERVAFGRQIGSFQAIKHQLADLSLAVESSKAISSVATRAVDGRMSFAADAASIAKAWVSDAGLSVAQGCFQIFGGLAFTWEHDCHLFFRRLTIDGLIFGSSAWHRERICRLPDDERMGTA